MNLEMEAKLSEMIRQLDEERRQCSLAEHQAEVLGKEAAAAQAMVKEVSSRAEFLRSEREKLLKVAQAEQQQAAALRQSVEALQAQVQRPKRRTSRWAIQPLPL